MSSFMQWRRDRSARTLTALVILMCALLWLGASEAAAADLTIVGAGVSRTDGLVSLVVEVGSATSEPIGPASFSVTARTVPQRVDAVPVLSDQLAVGVVVDGSEGGRPGLESGLAGAANFVLQQQPMAGAVVVADKAPPKVMSTAEAKPADVVPALSSIEAGGQRQTAEAVSVALRELQRIPARSRMVILHTAAADAGGLPASDLAAKLIDAHTALAVVSASPDSSYWLDVTRRTGGVLTTPAVGNVFAAFDQIADVMRSRYLLTFKPTAQSTSPIVVRLDTPEGSATAVTVVPSPPQNPSAAATPADPNGAPGWPLLLAIAALLAVVGLVFVVLARLGAVRLPRLPGPLQPSRLARLARSPRSRPADAPESPDGPPQPPSASAPTSANPPMASIRVDSPTGPITVDISSASARNGATPTTKAANGADTAPSSTDPTISAVNAAAAVTNAVSWTDFRASGPSQADPDNRDTCVCGCGRQVRPGRAFINREHQSRWLSHSGRGIRRSSL